MCCDKNNFVQPHCVILKPRESLLYQTPNLRANPACVGCSGVHSFPGKRGEHEPRDWQQVGIENILVVPCGQQPVNCRLLSLALSDVPQTV